MDREPSGIYIFFLFVTREPLDGLSTFQCWKSGSIDMVILELLFPVMVLILLVMYHLRCYRFAFVPDYLV